MEDNSMLCEHALLTSGDVADSGVSYAGWPARRLEDVIEMKDNTASFATRIPHMSNLPTFSEKPNH